MLSEKFLFFWPKVRECVHVICLVATTLILAKG